MKKNLLKTSIVIFLLFLSIGAFAQITPPTPEPGRRPGPGAPIDGGIVVLLAAGAAYGVKKLKSNRD